MPIHDDLPDELTEEKFVTVGTTLFAKTGDDLFQLKVGETSWTKIANVPELRFLIAAEGVLIIGSHTDWRRSTDGGETWVRITPKLETQSVEVDGIAVFGDTIYVLRSDGKLLRSTDNGRSWATTETGLGYQTIDDMVALSEHVVCVGTGAGVFRWTASEKSWRQINEGLSGTMVHSLVFFRNALYATTYNNNGVFKSVDGGNRWIPIHRGLPTTNVGVLTVSGGALYLGLNETNMGTQNPSTTGIYRLAADWNSWIPVQTEMRTADIDNHPREGYHQMSRVEELVISGDTFYAIAEMGMGYRLFRWRRGERFWTDISPDKTDWLYISGDDLKELAVAGKTVYIHANGDLMRSHNKGKTWSELDLDIPTSRYGHQIEGLVVLGKTVYISISGSGVFRSTDRGKTWESVNEGLPRAYSWEFHAVENTLYATDEDEGIFRLRDGRDSWEFVKPSPSDMMSALAVAGTTLYAGIGEKGVYRIVLENPDSD